MKLSQIPHATVIQVIKKCDVLVRASKFESYGLSRIEGILNLKPVVATNIGETRGMLLFEFGNNEMLKKQLEKALLFTDRDISKKWAEYYRKIASVNLQKFLEIIYVENKCES